MQAENRTARAWLFKWRYSLHEDILLLHLTRELVDLRKGYENSILLRRVKFSSATSTKNNASLDEDYLRLEQMALSKKQEKEFKEWLNKKIASMYIYIAPEFRGGDFENKNWVKYSK